MTANGHALNIAFIVTFIGCVASAYADSGGRLDLAVLGAMDFISGSRPGIVALAGGAALAFSAVLVGAVFAVVRLGIAAITAISALRK